MSRLVLALVLVSSAAPARATSFDDLVALTRLGLADDRVWDILVADPIDFPIDTKAAERLRRSGVAPALVDRLRLRQARAQLELTEPPAALARLRARTNGPSALDVLDLQLGGIAEATIITQLDATEARFPLLSKDLRRLGEVGLSKGLLDAIAARIGPAPTPAESPRPAPREPGPSAAMQERATTSAAEVDRPTAPGLAQAASPAGGLARPVTSRVDVVGRDDGVAMTARVQLGEAELRRKAWVSRGGSILAISAAAGLTFMEMSAADMSGFGGGASFDLDRLTMSPPIPGESDNWTAFRLGTGAGVSFMTTEFTDYYGDVYSSSSTQIDLRVNLGVVFGLGGFSDDNVWRGLAIGINWRPTYTIPGEGDASFNFLGFGFDFDITSFENAMKEIAKEAHFRISAFILPPIDDLPFILSLSIGAVWY